MVNGNGNDKNEKYFGMTESEYNALDPEVRRELEILKSKRDFNGIVANKIIGILKGETLQGAVDIMKIVNQDITTRVQNLMDTEKVQDWQ